MVEADGKVEEASLTVLWGEVARPVVWCGVVVWWWWWWWWCELLGCC